MNEELIGEMTFEEYFVYQLPLAKQFAEGQPESFYRRQALRNYENIQMRNAVRKKKREVKGEDPPDAVPLCEE